MVKLISIGKYRPYIPEENFFKKIWNWFTSLDKFTKFGLVILILVFLAATDNKELLSILGHAATNKNATISVTPFQGSFTVGQQFIVNVGISGGGQAFNAAQANVSVSSNLTIQDLTVTASSSGGCNFYFINNQHTPTKTNPSFAGAIFNGSSTSCLVYSLTLVANATGIGTVTLQNGSVKEYGDSSEILSSMQSGSYSIGGVATPTPTTVPTATPTPTTMPTATPTPTTAPTSIPTPTNQPVVPPTINSQAPNTYATSVTLTGTKDPSIVAVNVNGSTNSVTYPTSTTWQAVEPFVISQPNVAASPTIFNVYGINALGIGSSLTSVTITNHRLGDINGDGVIDLTDLSMFATDYENTGTLNYPLSDMNGDGVIDLGDFSIFAKAYGN